MNISTNSCRQWDISLLMIFEYCSGNQIHKFVYILRPKWNKSPLLLLLSLFLWCWVLLFNFISLHLFLRNFCLSPEWFLPNSLAKCISKFLRGLHFLEEIWRWYAVVLVKWLISQRTNWNLNLDTYRVCCFRNNKQWKGHILTRSEIQMRGIKFL